MSDSTNPGATGDFRGSREEKRQDETVVLNADNLADLVSQAKGQSDAGPAPVSEPAVPGGPNLVVIGIGVAVVVIVVLAIIFMVASGN